MPDTTTTNINNVIIFEGPDGGGKTTNAKKLAAKLGWTYYKRPGPPASWEEDIRGIEESIKLVQGKGGPHVMDRAAFISAAIYGDLIWGKSPITIERAADIIREYKPMLFYCRPADGVLLDLERRHKPNQNEPERYLEMIGVKKKEIIERYDRLMDEVKPFAWCIY